MVTNNDEDEYLMMIMTMIINATSITRCPVTTKIVRDA